MDKTIGAISVVVIAILLMLIGLHFFTFTVSFNFLGHPVSLSNLSVENPQIQNGGSAQISYPSNYATLANYTLGLINQERQSFGLGNVSLSQIQSAQQHADSMLY